MEEGILFLCIAGILFQLSLEILLNFQKTLQENQVFLLGSGRGGCHSFYNRNILNEKKTSWYGSMTKMLICYYSKTGTTEEMAEEIYEGAKEADVDLEVDLKMVEDVDISALPEYDSIVLGSPTYYGLPSSEIKKFLDKSIEHHGDLDGMVGGAFASSANTAGGNETTIIAILEALIIHGMVIKGMPKGDHYGPVVVGEAEKDDLEQCNYYGRWLAEFTEKISGSEVV